MTPFTPHHRAYIGPFLAFFALLILSQVVATLGDGYAHWVVAKPIYWVFPLQTFLCAFLLWRWREGFSLRPFGGFALSLLLGLVVFVIWIFPQTFMGEASRTSGFEPHFFSEEGSAYTLNVLLRFVRLVVIVPLVEELFWRGFLLRYLVREDFYAVPFGTFTWKAFTITSVAFCLEHQPVDWPAALLAGMIYNGIAITTRSLFACVMAHAVTNFALGVWIMKTGQWGFW